MTVVSIDESRGANGDEDGPSARWRVLLFDGPDRSVSAAAPALLGLGVDVERADPTATPAGPAHHTIAVVVASATSTRATADLVRRLRTVSAIPVLLLAPNLQDDVLLQEVSATGSGTGSLVPLELVQQIRAILRRAAARVLRFGLLEIDTGAREVRVDRQPIELSRREFDLITFLASSPGHAFTRRELLDAVWHSSGEWQTPSTVTEHVRRLRLKLHPRADLPVWLVTVRGTGYRFQP